MGTEANISHNWGNLSYVYKQPRPDCNLVPILTLVPLNKDAMPISNFQSIRLLDVNTPAQEPLKDQFYQVALFRHVTLVMLNKLRCLTNFKYLASQITWSRLLIQIHILDSKQCRSRSVGFCRSQLICIFTVCKCRAYLVQQNQGSPCRAE